MFSLFGPPSGADTMRIFPKTTFKIQIFLMIMGSLIQQVSSLFLTRDLEVRTDHVRTGNAYLEYHFRGCNDMYVRLYCDANIYDIVERGYQNKIGFIRISDTKKRLISRVASAEGCDNAQKFWISWKRGMIATGKGSLGEHVHMKYDTKKLDLKCEKIEPVFVYSPGSSFCIEDMKMEDVSFNKMSIGSSFRGKVFKALPRKPSRAVCASICLRSCPCYAVLYSITHELCSLVGDVAGKPLRRGDVYIIK